MRSSLLMIASLAFAAHASAAPLIVRSKGAQIDEAVAALKREVAGATELSVDDAGADVAARAAGAEVIIAVGARAAQLALKHTSAPVVHCMVLQDAAALDSARSVGVPLSVPANVQLSTLKRVAPATKKVGLLYDPKINGRFAEEVVRAARPYALTIVAKPVSASTQAPAALDELLPQVDALLVAPDATVVSKELITFIVARAFERRLPVLTYSESFVKVGALAALAPSYAKNGELCGKLAKRVIAGEKPEALRGAIEMPGDLVVNVATARRLGLTIAPDLLRPPTRLVGQ